MKKQHKKILWFIFFLITVNVSYFLIPWGILEAEREFFQIRLAFATNFLGFSFLTPTIFIVQGVLLYLYFFKAYSKKIIIIISIIILFFHSMLAIVPAKDCEENFSVQKSCDCLGLKRVELFGGSCIGKRTKCYYYGKEKPCNEVFPERR